MEIHELDDVVGRREASGRPYLEFQRFDALSTGLYVLPAGGTDPQSPHAEDEIYYVIAGRGRIRVGDQDAPVRPGSVVAVPAGAAHRFYAIQEELRLLVVFGPAEGSRATGTRSVDAG